MELLHSSRAFAESLLFSEGHEVASHNVAMFFIIIILFLTLLFEFSHHWIVKKLAYQHLLVETINTLFQELTILGFISLILFSITRLGITQKINDGIFGESIVEKAAKKELKEEGEPTELAPTLLFELFEDTHIFIFVIMSIFILMGTYQVFIAIRQMKSWRKYEAKSIQDLREEISRNSFEYQEVQYWGLKQRFSNPLFPFAYVKDDRVKFDFSTYLCEKMARFLVEIVEIPFTTWIVILIIVILLKPVLDFPLMGTILFVVLCSIGIWILTTMININLRYIRNFLQPSIDDIREKIQEDNLINIPAPIDSVEYVIQTTGVQKIIQKTPYINRQDSLFLFGRKGRKYLLRILQLDLFFNTVLCTILIKMLMSNSWKKISSFKLTIVGILVPLMLSICNSLFYWPTLIRDYTMCSSLQDYVDPEVVRLIEDSARQKHFQRVVQILNHLKRLSYQQKTQVSAEKAEIILQQAVVKYNSQREETKNFYVDVFSINVDKDLTLSWSGLEKVRKLIQMKNQDLDPLITFWFNKLTEECVEKRLSLSQYEVLIGLVLWHLETSPLEISSYDMEEIFDIADSDSDGVIGLDDLQQILVDLNPPADVDEIKNLIKEISEREDKLITIESFKSWLIKVQAIICFGKGFKKAASHG